MNIPPGGQAARFVINGIAATVIHYAVLVVCMDIWRIESAGLASLIASCVGITASFFGNRHWVFRSTDEALARQALRFVALYATIALAHSALMHGWVDIGGWSYHVGFVIATLLQVTLSYGGGKHLVFKPRTAKIEPAQQP
jgi:putative flippase GtrA